MKRVFSLFSVIAILTILALGGCSKADPPGNDSARSTTTVEASSTTDESSAETSLITSTSSAVDEEMQIIDNRLLWLHENSANFTSREEGMYTDTYDGNALVCRYFSLESNDSHPDVAGAYSLYYDENGKVIYAEIAHYRSLMYNLYFTADTLLHAVIDGQIADDNEDMLTHISIDIPTCLDNAYN